MNVAVIPTSTDDEFRATAATVIERAIVQAIERSGRCTLGLSGGTTPGPVYTLLGTKRTIDWECVHIFLVDERCVPLTDDRSNAQLVGRTLLAAAPIPDVQRHFPNTLLSPADAADAYDETMHGLLPDSGPDVVVLGMGDDGHVASLFPRLSQADLTSTDYAIHTRVPLVEGKPRFPVVDRISVTPRVLRTAETKIFLLSGDGKKRAWEESTRDGAHPLDWPASLLLHNALAITRW